MALTSAFFCAPLRTGALIVGWLQLAFVVLELIAMSTVLSQDGEGVYDSSLIEELRKNGHLTTVLTVTYCILIMDVVVLASLLYGTYRGLSGFLMPYLIFFGVQTAILIKLVILTVIYMQKLPSITLLMGVVSIYFLCVVGGFRNQLRDGNRDIKCQV